MNPENPDRTFPIVVERWRSREEIRREYLDSLSPDELRQVGSSYYWYKYGLPAWQREQARKYDPEQPRVPAGNPDGGQWTSGATGTAAIYSEAETTEGVVLVASGVTIDYSDALTGDSIIDGTTKALCEKLADVMQKMDFIPTWTPQVYGTAVHVAFGNAVRFGGMEGIGFQDVEQSFGGEYGEPGSIRTDVVRRDAAGDVIAIYDVKTGGATLRPGRVQELREKTGVGPNVPIIELSVLRGASLKAHTRQPREIGQVVARLWRH